MLYILHLSVVHVLLEFFDTEGLPSSELSVSPTDLSSFSLIFFFRVVDRLGLQALVLPPGGM